MYKLIVLIAMAIIFSGCVRKKEPNVSLKDPKTILYVITAKGYDNTYLREADVCELKYVGDHCKTSKNPDSVGDIVNSFLCVSGKLYKIRDNNDSKGDLVDNYETCEFTIIVRESSTSF